MPNRITTTTFFDKYYKKYKNKFHTLQNELEDLVNDLLLNPYQGTDLGNGLFKIRLKCKSKNKGKSGGVRVVTYLLNVDDNSIDITLLIIYDKSEINDISKSELQQISKFL
jgi:hypothetical protein